MAVRGCVALALVVISTIPGPGAASTPPRGLPVGPCINIGNHLEAPFEGAWPGHRVEASDFATIKQAGFQTVRLPVRWDTHAAATAPYTVDPAYVARVRHLVDAAIAAGLNVILDSHNFEALHSDPVGAAPRFAAIWRQIAVAFAPLPNDRLWFELENEPHDKLTARNLLQIMTPALAAVRESNPDRPVIIGGESWSGIDSLATLTLPDDPNVYPTFHYYEPFDFTHQGATWVKPSPPIGRTYGSEADAARLVRDVEKVRAYEARTGLRPFIGESGAHTTAPLAQRVRYHQAVTRAFAPLGLGMCVWAYDNTFPFYDQRRQAWLPGLRGAIGLPEAAPARRKR